MPGACGSPGASWVRPSRPGYRYWTAAPGTRPGTPCPRAAHRPRRRPGRPDAGRPAPATAAASRRWRRYGGNPRRGYPPTRSQAP
ncbi:hypothetical protein G6F65_023360 [Rhizopus arrhizus]|nr:hypothetical protein G6F65_023360 [Rhizopus arrhizus]KAG1373837.1 hypothetical protein G6F59_018463 [Rhizopus arrhizus]